MNWYEPWTTVKCPHCDGDIQVCKVDEDYIQESGMNPDFVEGDNWLHDKGQTEHPKYIPDHHVFLSSGLFEIGMDKVVKTLSHELFEVLFESKGLPYEKAHPLANIFETRVGKALHGG